ncbi:polysaccharide pyruvyl transferase family protein [Klenkia sp. LSe6-5]|uniref:Polysaccharide pyruvyl transferase family protein n=1 Tax=Klenkia sesuvii TaxID=3103137 RepID=A0ABU8E1A1_9ACTN
MTRVLVVGWFSFTEVIATVGDERAAQVVGGWLTGAGIAHDVAWARYLGRGVDHARVEPAGYTHLVWVCGPLVDDPLLTGLLDRFGAARRLAVGVSVVDPGTAARFDAVWARDSPGERPRPDLAIDPPGDGPAVVATVFAPVQPEYGERGWHEHVQDVVERWIADRGLGCFDVATDLLTPTGHERRVAQVAAVLGRADVVVTSRLHGLVLGLGRGRPVVAVDPVVGGAKVSAQARALGWPVLLGADEVDAVALDAALDRCLLPATPLLPAWADIARSAADQRARLLAALAG